MAQEAMEIPEETTNAGALQESGKRSTRSYINALFPGDFVMLRCVGQSVRTLRSIWCHMLKRMAMHASWNLLDGVSHFRCGLRQHGRQLRHILGEGRGGFSLQGRQQLRSRVPARRS
eukprot:4010211-Pleurochrysis_carterae.AAC.1